VRAGYEQAADLDDVLSRVRKLRVLTVDISRRDWATVRCALDAEGERLTSRLARSTQARALTHFAALDGDMWQRWEHPSMTRAARRALIQACVNSIDVHPANPARRWDPDRIRPDWLV
jgi:hypothetical protein